MKSHRRHWEYWSPPDGRDDAASTLSQHCLRAVLTGVCGYKKISYVIADYWSSFRVIPARAGENLVGTVVLVPISGYRSSSV